MVSDLMQLFCTLFLIGLGYFIHSKFNQSTLKLISFIEDHVESLKIEHERELNRLQFDLEISEKVIKERNNSIRRLEKMVSEMKDKVIKEVENEKPLSSDLLSDFI